MPKPIKKKAVRKERAEEDVRSTYHHLQEYYHTHTRRVRTIAIAAAVIIAVVVCVFLYQRSTAEKAERLAYEAYRSYADGITKNDKALLADALEKFQKAGGARPSARTLYYEADIHARRGDVNKAIETLNSLIRDFPADAEMRAFAYGKLGDLYLNGKDHDKALQTFEALSQEGMLFYRDRALFAMAAVQRRQGKEDDAKKTLERLVKEFPASPYAKGLAPEAKGTGEGAGKKPAGQAK